MTAGRGSGKRARPPKEILVLPPGRNFRDVLQGRASPARQPRPPRPGMDDPLTAMWLRVIDAATGLANGHDLRWMRRRRILNSLIVMLFVFRLVLSRGGKGYATLVAELREQCRKPGIALPQREPVAASSIRKARQRVHGDLFIDLHREILRHGGEGARWKGHRLFAVDGTKMNLPRQPVSAGYPLPNDGAHYPQGLVSCLYRLDTKVPVDFSLSARACERTAASGHLHALEPGDIVVSGRGYFSSGLLHDVIATGAHPVFRLKRNSAGAFRDFMEGDGAETTVSAAPGPDTRRQLAKRRPGETFGPAGIRLVRCRTDAGAYDPATTLPATGHVSAAELADPATGAGRPGSLQGLQTDHRGGRVPQPDRARRPPGAPVAFQPCAMTRLFSGHGDSLLADMREEGKERQAVNFRNAIAIVAASLEELLLGQAVAVARAVSRMAEEILRVRIRIRSGRSYPRESMQPAGKWGRRGKTGKS